MYQNFERGACDPYAPYRPAFYGTFELPVPVGRKQRRMLAYVPKDVRESTAGIIVLGAIVLRSLPQRQKHPSNG